MANQPRPDNPNRVIRMEDTMWEDVQALAREDTDAAGVRVSASDIVRTAAAQYIRRRSAAAQRRKSA